MSNMKRFNYNDEKSKILNPTSLWNYKLDGNMELKFDAIEKTVSFLYVPEGKTLFSTLEAPHYIFFFSS